ncbi:MAG: DUF4388 domain-containing protein [bacterium]|nr:DUF4388 domain-containing protein [bacterium]
MNIERLDHILIRLGLVTDEKLQEALKRQRSNGGRLGSHLIALGYLTEEQFVSALAEQYGVPAFDEATQEVDPDVVDKLPVDLAEKFYAVPIGMEGPKTLKLVVADPENREIVASVKQATGANRIVLFVAGEAAIKKLIQRHYRGDVIESNRIIDLPELFDDIGKRTTRRPGDEPNEERHVLLVGKSVYLMNLLGPVFEREGYKLHLATNLSEVENTLSKEPIHHLLVSENDVERFSAWLRKSGFQLGQMELSSYGNLGATLLQNPVPYRRVIRSLLRSLQIIAELRCASAGWIPPYVLICNDIHNLARNLGVRRLATDGLQVASYLLVPAGAPSGTSPKRNTTTALAFVDLDKSLEHAKSLHFPWDVEGVLRAFREYLSGDRDPNETEETISEVSLAAQVLAIVWYRRVIFRNVEGSTEKAVAKIKSGLKKQAGKLASLEVVEAYIRLFDRHNESRETGSFNQIFIVGRVDSLTKKFESHLSASGFSTFIVDDLAEAHDLCKRQTPAALLIHRESFPDEISHAIRFFKLNSAVLLYAITKTSDSSVILDLLDMGFDDVFSHPYDFEIIAARISKSVRGISQKTRKPDKPRGFSANFKAFAFIDLIQTLGHSRKTVHVSLHNTADESADIYLRKGKLVNGECGKLTGVEAIYRVIAWRENGAFAAEPEEHFPPDNIFESNETILMEGCRLLDESTIKQ